MIFYWSPVQCLWLPWVPITISAGAVLAPMIVEFPLVINILYLIPVITPHSFWWLSIRTSHCSLISVNWFVGCFNCSLDSGGSPVLQTPFLFFLSQHFRDSSLMFLAWSSGSRPCCSRSFVAPLTVSQIQGLFCGLFRYLMIPLFLRSRHYPLVPLAVSWFLWLCPQLEIVPLSVWLSLRYF